jgi:hypothetical protein
MFASKLRLTLKLFQTGQRSPEVNILTINTLSTTVLQQALSVDWESCPVCSTLLISVKERAATQLLEGTL